MEIACQDVLNRTEHDRKVDEVWKEIDGVAWKER